MPRPKSTANMTIAELEKMLNERRSRLGGLMESRRKLQMQLAAVDKELAALSGGSTGMKTTTAPAPTPTKSTSPSSKGGKKRAKNSMSLVAMLEKVLTDAGAPVAVGDILAGVEKGGYKSSSGNFRGLINQTLIKDKRFASAGRGLYEMKKG